jgi:uncharacterized membrane protein YgcG
MRERMRPHFRKGDGVYFLGMVHGIRENFSG